MNFKICIFLFIFLILANTRSSCNGFSFNSPGPTGLGMAGAIVGMANDYSTIYFNPAGLINLDKPQLGIYYSAIIPMGIYKVIPPPPAINVNIDIKTETNIYNAPGAMGYIPFLFGNFVCGIGIFVPSSYGVEWNGKDLSNLLKGTALKWSSQFSTIIASPAIAFNILGKVYIGAALSLNYSSIDIEKPYKVFVNDQPQYHQFNESGTGFGYGFSAGLLYHPHNLVTIGASFKTRTNVKLNGNATNAAMKFRQLPDKSDFERNLYSPMWIGAGIAVHPFDILDVCLDFHWSNWSGSYKEIVTEYSAWLDISNQNQITPLKDTLKLNWKDALQVRLGAELDIVDNIKLRCGVYTDPATAPDETYTILYPNVSFIGMTLGGTMRFENLAIDLGLEYLVGKERIINLTNSFWDLIPEVIQGTHNMNIITISLGFNYNFGSTPE